MKPHLLAALALALIAQSAVAEPPATVPAVRVETVERLLKSGVEDDALQAFATLHALGPDGAAALPAVVRYLTGKAHAETIKRSGLFMSGTVLNVGPAAVPPLVGLLTDTDVRVRGTAAMFLGNFSRFSPEARAEMLKSLPQLTAALGDADPRVQQVRRRRIQVSRPRRRVGRAGAAEAVRRLGPPPHGGGGGGGAGDRP